MDLSAKNFFFLTGGGKKKIIFNLDYLLDIFEAKHRYRPFNSFLSLKKNRTKFACGRMGLLIPLTPLFTTVNGTKEALICS